MVQGNFCVSAVSVPCEGFAADLLFVISSETSANSGLLSNTILLLDLNFNPFCEFWSSFEHHPSLGPEFQPILESPCTDTKLCVVRSSSCSLGSQLAGVVRLGKQLNMLLKGGRADGLLHSKTGQRVVDVESGVSGHITCAVHECDHANDRCKSL